MGSPAPAQKPSSNRRRPVLFALLLLLACLTGFSIGWWAKQAADTSLHPTPIRLSGYQFTSPLLSCNFNATKLFPEYQPLSAKIQNVITASEQAGDISKASTYFADFSNGYWSDTGESYKYYPSSLGKVPILIAYYQLAESSDTVLDKEITFPIGSPNLNTTQDITPPKAIVPGQTYTVDQLIDYMIKYSDNNAAQLLYENIDPSILQKVYTDLQIPFEEDPTINTLDFISPDQVSTMFRVLYNATYLSHDDSEKALALMSQSSFIQGIVAGVPSSTVVSHKLGLVVIQTNGVTTEHELHDCGIVYAPSHPYTLCIMTRGTSSLATMENVVANISKTVYQEVENNYQ